jgi:prevent-host-death family protein
MRVMTPKSRRKARPEIPVNELRANVKDVLNRVQFGGERIVVTRNGDEAVALVPLSDLEKIEAA